MLEKNPGGTGWSRIHCPFDSVFAIAGPTTPSYKKNLSAKTATLMAPPLLTALDSVGHVHLIVGSNPLASARCSKSIEVGAKPKILVPADSDVHYVLAKRIEDREVEWIKKNFEDTDLSTLGRDEVDKVVDAVFVTAQGNNVKSMRSLVHTRTQNLPVVHRHTHF